MAPETRARKMYGRRRHLIGRHTEASQRERDHAASHASSVHAGMPAGVLQVHQVTLRWLLGSCRLGTRLINGSRMPTGVLQAQLDEGDCCSRHSDHVRTMLLCRVQPRTCDLELSDPTMCVPRCSRHSDDAVVSGRRHLLPHLHLNKRYIFYSGCNAGTPNVERDHSEAFALPGAPGRPRCQMRKVPTSNLAPGAGHTLSRPHVRLARACVLLLKRVELGLRSLIILLLLHLLLLLILLCY